MWKAIVLLVAAFSAGCGYLCPPNELAAAARAGNLDRMDALVESGADVDEPSGINRWPPVLHAIHKGQVGALRHLVDLGASLDGDRGRQALLMASGYGDEPIVRFLLERGVTPRAAGDSGSRLMSAAVQGAADVDYRWVGCAPHTNVVRTLLAHDPKLRLGTSQPSRAARAWAHAKGCDEMLRVLKESR